MSLVHGGLLTVTGDAEAGLTWEATGWRKSRATYSKRMLSMVSTEL